MWVYDKPVIVDICVLINESSFELWMETILMLMIFAVILCYLSSTNERPEWDSNPNLCNACAVLYQLSYQANWKLVIMWVYKKPVDSSSPKKPVEVL